MMTILIILFFFYSKMIEMSHLNIKMIKQNPHFQQIDLGLTHLKLAHLTTYAHLTHRTFYGPCENRTHSVSRVISL